MTLIYIVAFIAIATIVGVLVWFTHQHLDINCSNNGCTGDCVDKTPEINPNWPFPTGPKP